MKLIDILVGSNDGMSLFGLRTKYLAMDHDGRVYGYTEMPTPGIIGWSVPDNLYSTDGRGCLIQIDRDDVDGQWQSAIITREQYEAALAAKNDDWIDWGGGECPVKEGVLVDVRYRNGKENHHIGAGISFDDTGSNPDHNAEDWNNDDSPLDIIAYRLHKPQEAAQQKADDEIYLNECIGRDDAPVWSGEGLPPVGCEFEYGSHRTKAKCLAVAHHMVFASKGNPDDEESDYEEFMISILGSEFHRVRTEAERKRDEAVKTIMLTGWCQAAAEEIYDLVAAGKVPGMKLEV